MFRDEDRLLGKDDPPSGQAKRLSGRGNPLAWFRCPMCEGKMSEGNSGSWNGEDDTNEGEFLFTIGIPDKTGFVAPGKITCDRTPGLKGGKFFALFSYCFPSLFYKTKSFFLS
jgi:hypothetical protein